MEVRRVDLAKWAFRTSQELNINSMRVFDQIKDSEIPITLRPLPLNPSGIEPGSVGCKEGILPITPQRRTRFPSIPYKFSGSIVSNGVEE